MLGLEEAENSKTLQLLVDKAVVVLNNLRKLQLRVTFESLGMDIQHGCGNKSEKTDEDVTKLMEQYTNSQVF